MLIVAFSDDVLTARSFARRGEKIIANRELLALGVANAGSSLVRGFPVSSSATRTAIGVATGSRTQLYSLTAAASVVAVLLFLRPVLSLFPTAALGAIVIYAAIRLIDLPAMRRLYTFRRAELAIALATCIAVLALDIVYGVLVAIGLSVAELLIRVARAHDAIEGLVPGLAGMHNVNDYPDSRIIPGLVVYRYDAPLFFANAENFRSRAIAAADQRPDPVRWFVLNVEANVEVDFTALEAVDAVREEITSRGGVFVLARVKQDLLARLQTFGLAEKIGARADVPYTANGIGGLREMGPAAQSAARPGKRRGGLSRPAVPSAGRRSCYSPKSAGRTGPPSITVPLTPVTKGVSRIPREKPIPQVGRAGKPGRFRFPS